MRLLALAAVAAAEQQVECWTDLPTDAYVDFSNSQVVHSNLGGMGDDLSAAPSVLFRNVGIDSATNRSFDIEISNLTAYTPAKASKNGLNERFAQINLKVPLDVDHPFPHDGDYPPFTHTELLFEFQDTLTSQPVTLARFPLTFFDFDEGAEQDTAPGRPNGRECISLYEFDQFFLADDTE
eukprot:430429-Prymnesium_polylepis.1